MTEEQLQAISGRAELLTFDSAYVKGDPWKGYEVYNEHNALLIAELSNLHDAEFLAESCKDVPALLAEVERLRSAIDNAASLLPDGESRLANRHLCGALGVDENHYGYFGEDDE